MAVRLVRKAEERASISNRDDACMVRYAYGYDGIVQHFAGQLEATISADRSSVSLAKGKVVLNGWEIDIDEETFSLGNFPSSGIVYSYIYVELKLFTETVKIAAVRSADSVFPLGLGDDLTHFPNGTARLCLYKIAINSGGVYSKTQIAPLIPLFREFKESTDEHLRLIDERLEKLGFREGSIVLPANTPQHSFTASTNYLKRQGNYVIGQYAFNYSQLGDAPALDTSTIIGTVPKEFRPADTVYLIGVANCLVPSGVGITTVWLTLPTTFYISANGSVGFVSASGVDVFKLGYCRLQLGYEAAPITDEF